MPRRFKRRKTFRRPQRRVRRGRRRFLGIPRGVPRPIRVGTQVPDRMLVRLKYVSTLNADAVPFIYQLKFNMNSIFDPDKTFAGHQVLGHDQWNQFYNRYRVYKYTYRVQVQNTGQTPCVLIVYPSNDDITYADYTTLIEQKGAKFKVLGPATGSSNATIGGSVSIPRLFGRNRSQYMADDIYSASFGLSPSEGAQMNIVVASSDSTSAVNYSGTLESWYYCELYDRFDLTKS